MKQHIKLKVCGMRDVKNIRQLVEIQPDYIGFIFYPGSKRYAEPLDDRFLDTLPSNIKKTGVFVDAAYDEISTVVERYELDAVQLHGTESPELCGLLQQSGIEVIKAFGIDSTFDFNTLTEFNPVVDYFLFDTKTAQHGGSGQLFDWSILKNYNLDKGYFLSGGLSAEQLSELLKYEDPRLYALDLNSRFELEPGLKNIPQLTSFFNAIKIPGRD
jgi:phosphoribosylanthranilate isomerase